MTHQQLYDFFEKNPNTDIVDEAGVTHYYMFWVQHRLEWLQNQAAGYQYDLKTIHANTPAYFYTEREMKKVISQIMKLQDARQRQGNAKVVVAPAHSEIGKETVVETAWRMVRQVFGRSVQ